MAKPEDLKETTVPLAEFLESIPPGTRVSVPDLQRGTTRQGSHLVPPEIQLFCESDVCRGKRFFHSTDDHGFIHEPTTLFLEYNCRNCGRSLKIFALLIHHTENLAGEVYKIGEYPPFGPPIPSRVISLVGPDRELFIRGRRSENQGLGIGAFAYYRRVVENQWKRLVDEILKVADRVGAPGDRIAALKKAREETQFSKAVDTLKVALPDVLLINGHNPLTLLHKALSQGLHEQSEDECLRFGSSMRIILTELAERIGLALKDQAELEEAVNRLLNRPAPNRGDGPE